MKENYSYRAIGTHVKEGEIICVSFDYKGDIYEKDFDLDARKLLNWEYKTPGYFVADIIKHFRERINKNSITFSEKLTTNEIGDLCTKTRFSFKSERIFLFKCPDCEKCFKAYRETLKSFILCPSCGNTYRCNSSSLVLRKTSQAKHVKDRK